MQLSLQTIFQFVFAFSFEAGIDYFWKTSTSYYDYAAGNFKVVEGLSTI